ncbi:MAG TPA: hypothetical protein VFO41_09900 [Alphaproteobacteria bacterium]|nr:hypothetical protein [Alphaproteobacteria bacterium]
MFFASEYLVAAVIAALLFVFVIATNRHNRRRKPSRSTPGTGRNVKA